LSPETGKALETQLLPLLLVLERNRWYKPY